MTEVPEHLLKRAQEAKDKAAAKKAEASGGDTAESGGDAPAADSRIPAHLLERSKAAKAAKAGGDAEASGGGGGTAVATKPEAPVAASAGLPTGAGPGGHTQRLLTVVKSGSIQDVKAKPQDKVHVWPHLLVIEFVAALAMTAFVFVFSWLVERTVARAGELQRDAEPLQGPVVLPGSSGVAHDVPSDGGRCDDSRNGDLRVDTRALHRQEPLQQARGPQVRAFPS